MNPQGTISLKVSLILFTFWTIPKYNTKNFVFEMRTRQLIFMSRTEVLVSVIRFENKMKIFIFFKKTSPMWCTLAQFKSVSTYISTDFILTSALTHQAKTLVYKKWLSHLKKKQNNSDNNDKKFNCQKWL